MATTAIAICRFCTVGLLLVTLPGRWCAPRSKNSYRSSLPQTVYDQKQTGDYNIQLHLRDFQIIALLGDDSFSGDYDYNYDYSDFTLKPSTPKPSTPQPSTPPPSANPPSITKPSPTPSNATSASETPPAQEPVLKDKPQTAQEPVLKDKPETITSDLGRPSNVTDVVEIVESSTAPHSKDKPSENDTNSPGKIKVQIIETPVGVVPGENPEKDGVVAHEEVLQIRRCANGFTRDKRGRCRRVRRPGSASAKIPYGISKLANNLASRFRYSSSPESLPSSESTED